MTALDPSRLSRVASQVQIAHEGAGMAWLLSERFRRATTDEARAELVTQIGQETRKAHDASREALESLQDAGAVLQDRKSAPVNPLAELARVENSRAEALALLAALTHAHQLAEALDAKRGDVLDEPIAGSAGLVWGEDLVQLKSKLELELFGPSGAVTGGRE